MPLDESKLDPESRRQLWEIRVNDKLKSLEEAIQKLVEVGKNLLQNIKENESRIIKLRDDQNDVVKQLEIRLAARLTPIEKVGLLQRIINWWQNRDSLKTLGAVRSSAWPRVRAEHLRQHPNCAVCGGNKTIEVHHKQPFHINPVLELEPSNLITLCESGANGIVCHRAIGHLGNYRSVNVKVEEDAKIWSEKIANRP